MASVAAGSGNVGTRVFLIMDGGLRAMEVSLDVLMLGRLNLPL